MASARTASPGHWRQAPIVRALRRGGRMCKKKGGIVCEKIARGRGRRAPRREGGCALSCAKRYASSRISRHFAGPRIEPASIATLRGLIIVSIPKHSTLTARSLTRTLRSGEQQEPSHKFSLCYINVEVFEEVGGPKRTPPNPLQLQRASGIQSRQDLNLRGKTQKIIRCSLVCVFDILVFRLNHSAT